MNPISEQLKIFWPLKKFIFAIIWSLCSQGLVFSYLLHEPNITKVLFNDKRLYRYGTSKNVRIRFCKGRVNIPNRMIFFWQIWLHICEEIWWLDSMKCRMQAHAFFKVCLVLIFLYTFVEKHSLNPDISMLYQIYDQKALFKVPKICIINF